MMKKNNKNNKSIDFFVTNREDLIYDSTNLSNLLLFKKELIY